MFSELRADLVLAGGRVWTGVDRRRPVDAVAVRDGRVLAVGTTAELAWAIGPRTRRVGLAGRLLLPAFHDAHVHPVAAGLAMERCQLADLADADAYRAAVAAWAREHPELPWILGEGWTVAGFGGTVPGVADLDAAVPDRPALIHSADGHSAWANSAALSAAGVGAETPDPQGGRIIRGPDGSPVGLLLERAAWLVEQHAPRPTSAELEDALTRGQAHLHALGVAGWTDANVTPEQEAAYVAVLRRGQLTARASLALGWDPDRGTDQVADLVARRTALAALEEEDPGRIRTAGVKLFQDGVLEIGTAALLDPYLDGEGRATRARGRSLYAPDALREVCAALDAERFAIHVHAVGDRAVREALDALTAARKRNGPRDARHTIAHVQLVDPTDLIRFEALKVIASCQPLWAVDDEDTRTVTRPLLGDERTARMYPFGSLLRTGADLAFGSDWSVTTADPLRILDAAITRTDPTAGDGAAAPLGPASERLKAEQALRAYTRGAAHAGWLDDQSGTIEEGKAADLVVLDRDPLAPGGGSWAAARVVLTLVDGRPVHQDVAFDGRE